MMPIKTYTATIKITFETHEKENPRLIAKDMANIHNGTRGANLYTYSVVETLSEKIEPKSKITRKSDA